jgi:hypothetical protein
MDDSQQRMDDSQQGKRPTAWIVATAVLALVAIGFAIWGFTTNSDLDDANATIDRQKTQLAAQEGEATQTERRLRAFGARERAAFRRVRRRFIREEAEAGRLKQTIQKEAGEVQTARNETAAAEGQDEKDRAALKEAQQESQLSAACVKGAVNALDRFFNASSAKAGANAAVAELQSIQDQCQSAN